MPSKAIIFFKMLIYSKQKQTSFSEKGSGFLMKYGVKAGLNMTSMSNDMAFEPGFGMGVGFRVGGFLNMRWGYRTAVRY